MLCAVAVLGACGDDGGDGEPAADTTETTLSGTSSDIDTSALLEDLAEATEGLGEERSAEVAGVIQQVIQEVIAEAVGNVGDPLTPEELNALFRERMAEAGVPLPE